MISTWGIFWIAFFGASVVKCLIAHLLPVKIPKLTDEQKEKGREYLKELTEVFAKNININATIPATTAKKATKKADK